MSKVLNLISFAKFLQCFGLCPFYWIRSTSIVVKLILVCYSFALYGFVYNVVLRNSINTLKNLITLEFNFGTFVLITTDINSLISYLTIPLLYWKLSNELPKHFDKWLKLNENFSNPRIRKSIGSGSNSHLWNKCEIFKTVIRVSFLAIAVILATYFESSSIYSYGIMLMCSILSFLWTETCEGIVETLNLLELQIENSNSRIKIFDFSTQELISSWISLCDFIKSTCYQYSTLLFSSLASMTLLVMLSIHTLLTRTIKTEVDLHEYFHSIVILILILSNIYTICNTSHCTEKQMKLILQDRILGNRIFLCETKKLIKIKQMLYVIKVTTPSICLFNFIKIDRPLMVNLLSVVATYLVVLIQFEVTSNNPASFNKTDILLITANPL